jgi:formylmethanofuran dehydrogenase subunit E
MYPDADKNQAQMRAYREMPDEDLFDMRWVQVHIPPEEMPGYKGEHVVCDECGERISFKREVRRDGRVLCRGCAGESYYEELADTAD